MENKDEQKLSVLRFSLILLLVIIGVALCLDLTYVFYKANFLDVALPSFCTVNELIDCDGVAKTSYSLSMGVPNSIWGLILYSVILMLLFVDKIKAKFPNSIFNVFKNPRSYIAALSLLAFIISMVLAFISIKIIHKICYLCFCTYFVDLSIALLARTKGFFIHDIKTTVLDFIDGAKKHFILFLVVFVTFIAALIYLDSTLVASPKLKKEREMKEFFNAKENKYSIKGNVLGNKNAKVKINVYSDYNCPFCKVVNIMVHKLAKGGKVVVEEVNFPLDTSCNSKIRNTLGGHDNSCQYARYALAAKNQGKFWGVADILFYKHPNNTEELTEYIKKAHLGIDIDKLIKDAQSEEIDKIIQADIEKAYASGINATPSLEINDVVYVGAMPYNDLVEKTKLAEKRLENDKTDTENK